MLWVPLVELPSLAHLLVVQTRDQLVNDILQRLVSSENEILF